MKKLLYILLALVAIVVVYLSINGLWRSATVNHTAVPEYNVIGLTYRGPYHNIGDTFKKLEELCQQAGVAKNMIGIYFDNPEEVQEDSLRSMATVIVNSADSAKLAALGCKPYHLPAGDALTVDWSYSNMTEMMIGIFKSYAALGQACQEENSMMQVGHVYEKYAEESVQFVFVKDKK
jgi:DNA gyrase inhibitor GyrI